jgi:hypothetical protein
MASTKPIRVGAEQRPAVAPVEPERPGAIGAAPQPPQQPELGGRPETGGGGGAERDLLAY